MYGSTVFRLSAVLLGFCAFGVYLLLSRTDQTVSRRIRRIGAVTASIAFCLFLFVVGTRPDAALQSALGIWSDADSHWWPDSQLQDLPMSIAFWLFAAGAVAAAAFSVCSSRPIGAALSLGLFSLFNAGLYVFHGAFFAAIAAVLFTGGAAAVLLWMETRGFANSSDVKRERGKGDERGVKKGRVKGLATSCDPALACVVGFLFSLTLVATISFSLTAEVVHKNGREGRSVLTTRFERPADRRKNANGRRQSAATSSRAATSFREEKGTGNRWILYTAATALSVASAVGVVLILRQPQFTTENAAEFTADGEGFR